MNRRVSTSRRWLVFFAAATLPVAGFLAGCGKSAPHSGEAQGEVVVTVKYGGAPVVEGRVDLNDEATGKGGGAELDDQGVARIGDVAVGSYTVTVLPPPPDPTPVPDGQRAPAGKKYLDIPVPYRKISTSPLRAEVKEGSNEFEFDLKSSK